MKKQAIVLLADGFELVEAMTVVDYLKRAGIGVTTVSINEKDVMSQSDVYVRADEIYSEGITPPDALIIPGGAAGAKALASHDGVTSLIRRAAEAGKIVAAICAGPTVLEAAGVLDGKKGTSYPGFDEELSYASYEDGLAVTDGNIITSRGPATTIFFAEHLIRALTSDKVWGKVEKAILQDRVVDTYKS